MKAIFTCIALLVAGALAQSSFTINTPSNVVECQPTLLTWSGGQAPYYLSILPGSTPSATALENFPETSSTSLTWVCNIASGTSIGFTLRDSTGAVAQSAPITVNAGSSSDCLNTTSISSGPTAASSAAASTGAATTGGASASTGTTAASSASATTSASSGTSGASANAAKLGAVGVVGAAIAALFL